MGMILRDEVLPEQIGAFFQAAHNTFDIPIERPTVDLDWSTYAGKPFQLPWFLLAALTLVQSGMRVFIHRTEGHAPERMYTRATLEALGIPIAATLNDAVDNLCVSNFAFLPLHSLSSEL